ncbi:transposase [Pseudalkalibacillus caeni]|uniref:Transposase n=1 Tax=Exobacillus caeni TaxID=2574798 RepID=A0A5R9F0L9_9BACL|nr:helix-turn-helix domain-containing protein [Pseudalkalibacillus caeni]TLS36239.1 transposase [Pseudalkalibacillus caeni]
MVMRRTYSAQEKYELILAYESRDESIKDFQIQYGVAGYTVRRWKYLYDTSGMEGLHNSCEPNRYSKELKLTAVQEYLSGDLSLMEVCRKYEIASDSVLRRWIKAYNGHRDLKGMGKKGSMTKGRTTELEERIEIVKYCLENDKDYNLTAHKYDVSYQQAYQWVKKYLESGQEGLEDKRGRRKKEKELTAEERNQLEKKQLERENERLRAELAFLKKLEEIERRRR